MHREALPVLTASSVILRVKTVCSKTGSIALRGQFYDSMNSALYRALFYDSMTSESNQWPQTPSNLT